MQKLNYSHPVLIMMMHIQAMREEKDTSEIMGHVVTLYGVRYQN